MVVHMCLTAHSLLLASSASGEVEWLVPGYHAAAGGKERSGTS